MKKTLFLITAAVAMLACGCRHFSNQHTEATPGVAPIFTRLEQGVISEDGALRIGPKVVNRTTIDFAKMDSAEKLSEKWTITNNYGNKLEIALGKRDGKSGLLVTRRDQPNTSDDTCFFMGSKSFAVAPGGRYRLSIGVCSDLNLDQVTYRGWGESKPNFIMWMDENDNDVKQEFITLPRVRSDRASENVITGDVPPNAAKRRQGIYSAWRRRAESEELELYPLYACRFRMHRSRRRTRAFMHRRVKADIRRQRLRTGLLVGRGRSRWHVHFLQAVPLRRQERHA